MNLALGALIILLLLLPALFFRLGITSIHFNSLAKTNKASFSTELARKNFINILSKLNFSETLFFFSVVPLLLHFSSIVFLHAAGYQIKLSLLLDIFSSQKGVIRDNNVFNHDLVSFLLYIIVLTGASFVIGVFTTNIILGYPKLINLFIGENMYFKLFTGMLLDESKRKEVDLVLVDILSETKETTVIYSGFLEKYDIQSDRNELAYVTITGARRRDFRGSAKTEEDGKTKTTSYDNATGDMVIIPGKYFTIPGNKISTVNVTYINLSTIQNADGSTSQSMNTVS